MPRRELDRCEVIVIKIVTLFSQDPATWPDDSCQFEGTLFRRAASRLEECAVALGAVLGDYSRWGDELFGPGIEDLAEMVDKVIVGREKVPKGSSIFALEEWSEIRAFCIELLQESQVCPIPIKKPMQIEDMVELFSIRRDPQTRAARRRGSQRSV